MVNPANPLNLPDQLPIARYRLSFKLTTPLHLPPYAGSTLRGVFGHVLMENGLDKLIFSAPPDGRLNSSQKQTPPPAYIIEAPADGRRHYPAGGVYRLNIVLIGPIRHQLPLIVGSFQKAFGRGVGRAEGRGVLSALEVETEKSGWRDILSDGKIALHDNTIRLPAPYGGNVGMRFVTPLRLQQQGKVVSAGQFTAGIMLRQLMRRVSAMSSLYWQNTLNADFGKLCAEAERIRCRHDLHWQDWVRYSNRQRQQMNIGGLMGTCEIDDIPLHFGQLLQLGRWLHIGKETVFGHGFYLLRNS